MTSEDRDRSDYLARGIDDLRSAQADQRKDVRAVGEDVSDLSAKFNDVLLQVGIQTAAQLELADDIKAMNMARIELNEAWTVKAARWDRAADRVEQIESQVLRARVGFPKVATAVVLLLSGGGALTLIQHFFGL